MMRIDEYMYETDEMWRIVMSYSKCSMMSIWLIDFSCMFNSSADIYSQFIYQWRLTVASQSKCGNWAVFIRVHVFIRASCRCMPIHSFLKSLCHSFACMHVRMFIRSSYWTSYPSIPPFLFIHISHLPFLNSPFPNHISDNRFPDQHSYSHSHFTFTCTFILIFISSYSIHNFLIHICYPLNQNRSSFLAVALCRCFRIKRGLI